MKNTYLKISLPFALLSSFLLFAEEQQQQVIPMEQEEKLDFCRIGLNFDMFWATYRFDAKYPISDGTDIGYHDVHVQGRDRNAYEGLQFTFDVLEPNALYTGARIWGALGNTHRRLYVDDEKVVNRDVSSNVWLNIDYALGYNFQPSSSPHFLLSVFAGPGVHLERKFHKRASWNYGMVGFKIDQDLSKDISLGANFRTMYTYKVRDRYEVTDLGRSIRNHFWGVEFELPLTWHIGEKRVFDLQFNPYFLKFDINSPETILGARLGLGYSY